MSGSSKRAATTHEPEVAAVTKRTRGLDLEVFTVNFVDFGACAFSTVYVPAAHLRSKTLLFFRRLVAKCRSAHVQAKYVQDTDGYFCAILQLLLTSRPSVNVCLAEDDATLADLLDENEWSVTKTSRVDDSYIMTLTKGAYDISPVVQHRLALPIMTLGMTPGELDAAHANVPTFVLAGTITVPGRL
jgi:hypothetical protein